MLYRIKHLIETGAFGACAWMGEKMGIASSRVRLFFVYASFLALGSPVIIYMIIAFWVNLKNYLRDKIDPVRDL
ncbi:MAG: PspC family transcriptional regulator [Chitinophagaceae bacterium]|jgi:phage shock protein PspC (stress-responsive transcriptional regulator)|nr:PspC family transcriptional regulator [Bacteroidota bacterium]MBK9555075.1 PspC family transcriptional regulator [Bacteroidota bacterium]MBL0281863.1 PspC family transcriptional regulator [Bacteroidota bacterium]